MKRGLTGGTGDVNPQFFVMTAPQSAADTTTTTAFNIPIQRLPSGKSAQVMEILKFIVDFPTMPVIAATTESGDNMVCAVTTKSFGTTAVTSNEPTLLLFGRVQRFGAFTAGGSFGYQAASMPMVVDLTDGAGHGYLVATDQLYVQVQSAGTGQSNTCNVRVLYRWKNVGLNEYVGIVQSQQ